MVIIVTWMYIRIIFEINMVINTKSFDWWYDSAATTYICIDKYFKNVKEDKYFMMHNNAKAKLIGKGVVDLSFILKKKLL